MENKVKKKTISYTQFSKWFTCPRSFKLDYIDKLKQFEDNLIMSFGTAVHETMQEYLKLLYDVSEEKANELNLMNFFKTAFNAQIEKKKYLILPKK